jgi:hypothetical protein
VSYIVSISQLLAKILLHILHSKEIIPCALSNMQNLMVFL